MSNVRIQDANGRYVYSGMAKAEDTSIFEGYGALKLDDGKIYEGLWENGMPSGRGKLTYANGATFEGEFAGTFEPKGFGVYKTEELS